MRFDDGSSSASRLSKICHALFEMLQLIRWLFNFGLPMVFNANNFRLVVKPYQRSCYALRISRNVLSRRRWINEDRAHGATEPQKSKYRKMQSKLVSDVVTVLIEVEGITPLSFGKHHDAPELNNEKDKDYEKRTFREKLHANESGELYVPDMMFKKSLDAACKHSGKKISGRGKSTYTSKFERGCIPSGHFFLTALSGSPLLKSSIPGQELFVPSDGVAGSGKRVTKWFPFIEKWAATGEFTILDNVIDEETFKEMLKIAGTFIGLGRWRPQNGGLYGRFVVKSVSWQDGNGGSI
jgi:hypothetical protein